MLLWGRATGMHPAVSEEALLGAFQSQAIEKVVRKMLTIKEVSGGGSAVNTTRASKSVRLLFKRQLALVVTIAYQQLVVTICPQSPLPWFFAIGLIIVQPTVLSRVRQLRTGQGNVAATVTKCGNVTGRLDA